MDWIHESEDRRDQYNLLATLWQQQATNEDASPYEAASDLLFWDSPGDSCRAEDYCDPPMPTEDEQDRAESEFISDRMQLLQLQSGRSMLSRLMAEQALIAAEQSVALRPVYPYADMDTEAEEDELPARVEGEWVVLGKPSSSKQSEKEAEKHRPAPIRRPSNPHPCTIPDGRPTPKNADDAEQTCDNFKQFWEKDPNFKTPKPEGGGGAALSKARSFKDKVQCSIDLEHRDEAGPILDDDRHTFDNFDRLWEKDPRFLDRALHSSSASSRSALTQNNSKLPDFKVETKDIIQKHEVNVFNFIGSRESDRMSDCSKSRAVYDPHTKRQRYFTFEQQYKVVNRSGENDPAIRNAVVVVDCEVDVQVVLKVDPKQDAERKFLYSFVHYVRVFSDFKLETRAQMLQMSDISVSESVPEVFVREASGADVTNHKVTHYLCVLHSWAAVVSPKGSAFMQRRMSASTSQSIAHQDAKQQADDGGDAIQEQAESDEKTVSVSSRPRSLRQLERSNSK